jgi:hypothetical protein
MTAASQLRLRQQEQQQELVQVVAQSATVSLQGLA